VAFYAQPENYEKLVNYEAGGNVLYKHRVWTLSRASDGWVETVFRLTEPLVLATVSSDADAGRALHELTNLKRFVEATVAGGFRDTTVGTTTTQSLDYDVPAYMNASRGQPLCDFAAPEPVVLAFGFEDRMLEVLQDGFHRYGTHLAGLVKMVQRVPGVSFIRAVQYPGTSGPPIRHREPGPQYGPGYSSL
jgi:hypothetical protein